MAAKTTRKRRERKEFSVQEKCEAVLSIWSDRRSMTELCRELEVSYPVVQKWQSLAMEGMVQALSPKNPSEELPPRLSPRLEKMLARLDIRHGCGSVW